MRLSNSFCKIVKAFASLLVVIVLTECDYVEKRNVLLIVGNVPHLPHTVHTSDAPGTCSVTKIVKSQLKPASQPPVIHGK